MSVPLALDAPAPVRDLSAKNSAASRLDHLRHVIGHAAHLLPAQGPITVFIHHNTLHAFEDLPFTDAVATAGKLFGCQPYLSEQRYREELGRGRIRFTDLEAVLAEDAEDAPSSAEQRVLPGCTRRQLRLAMLQYPLRSGPTEELLWFVAETDALRRVRSDTSEAVRRRLVAETRHWVLRDLRGRLKNGMDTRPRGDSPAAVELAELLGRFDESRIESWSEATWEAVALQLLWRVCCRGMALAAEHSETRSEACPESRPDAMLPVRHRDLLLRVSGVDADLQVHDVLIRFCGAFVDQGLARWQLPRRDEGFFRAFCGLYRGDGFAEPWLREVARETAALDDHGVAPLEAIATSLDLLGVDRAEWDSYLSATLLALRGWGGIIHFLEQRGDRAVHPIPQGSLIEFLAIRLLLDRCAVADVARRTIGCTGLLAGLRDELRRRLPAPAPVGVEQRAFPAFQLAQVLGWMPEQLQRLGPAEWAELLHEIESFPALERRRPLPPGL
jgi:hypothetical protein